MSLEFCTLASGSSGNCSVLRVPGGRALLIDCGIGPRMTAQRMCGTGVSLRDIRAICLTHLDRDHFSPAWASTIVDRSIEVFCHAERAGYLLETVAFYCADPEQLGRLERLLRRFTDVEFEPIDGLRATPIQLAHDVAGSHGFVFDGFDSRIGFASDLGHVPRRLLDQFCDLDLLALESNYDPGLQLNSARPAFLKRRIMGGAGHLSNAQALAAVRRILDRCERDGRRLPSHIVLLHRSRQCNCPKLVRTLFAADRRIAPRLTLAEQYERSEWLRPKSVEPSVGEQLALLWG